MSHVRVVPAAFVALWGCLCAVGVIGGLPNEFSSKDARSITHNDDRLVIAAVLDDFHDAASKADGDRYFAHFAPQGVFIGTDATERWTVEQFRAFCKPYFDRGQGWTYTPTERHIVIEGGENAWEAGAWASFDELLHNDKYGQCRGTGSLIRQRDGAWKIMQYSLSIPLPNDIAGDIVTMIISRAAPGGGDDPRVGDTEAEPNPGAGVTTVYIARHAYRDDAVDPDDPPLTGAGRVMADNIANLLSSAELSACYTTEYRRTKQTAAPVATGHGLTVQKYDGFGHDALAASIRSSHRGEAVFVAGHSNTVPALIKALGIASPPKIADDQYGDVFVVTIDAAGRASLQHLRVGSK